MMTTAQLKQAHELTERITATERLVSEYRAAGEVIVSLPPPQELRAFAGGHGRCMVELTATEVRDAVLGALEGRLECMTRQLHELGVYDDGEHVGTTTA